MTPFTVLRGQAAALRRENIDTDAIIPAGYMLGSIHPDLGRGLFGNWRYERDFEERSDFVLNKEPYRHAVLLIAGTNFGCGSSREAAVWALAQFGIRCVVAPSFGEIFFNNCFKNGVLPIVLPHDRVDRLAGAAEAAREGEFVVDLPAQTIVSPSGESFPFAIAADRKHILVEGLDEIALTLRDDAAAIEDFQRDDRERRPWVYRWPD
jgi:3-isopropylmalate/(R)-2-methylmalate dehydratase small subunit